jgi:Fe-S-cluster-containing dehydrogenase component
MTQYGFFFDQSRCVACQTCAVACKDWNDIAAGPAKPLRIFAWEKGAFPALRINTLFAPCYHCENPVCVDVANGAMYKEDKYGAVLIDPDKANDPNLKAAWNACPYGAITFDSDSPDSTAYKCNMCIDRLEQGKQPICVMSCPQRALDFGPLDQMTEKYGNSQ